MFYNLQKILRSIQKLEFPFERYPQNGTVLPKASYLHNLRISAHCHYRQEKRAVYYRLYKWRCANPQHPCAAAECADKKSRPANIYIHCTYFGNKICNSPFFHYFFTSFYVSHLTVPQGYDKIYLLYYIRMYSLYIVYCSHYSGIASEHIFIRNDKCRLG